MLHWSEKSVENNTMETLKRVNAALGLLLLLCLTSVSAVPNLQQDHLPQQAALIRARRRAEEVSSTAIQYMEQLRTSLADEDGKPKLSNPGDPTEVWAMQDRGE